MLVTFHQGNISSEKISWLPPSGDGFVLNASSFVCQLPSQYCATTQHSQSSAHTTLSLGLAQLSSYFPQYASPLAHLSTCRELK